MCSIPKTPPPPPPPPAQTVSILETLKIPTEVTEDIYQAVLNNTSYCIWSEDNPELRRACIVSRICLKKPPYQYVWKKNKSIIQVGPTCGLVALSMLIDEQVAPDTILNLARSAKYTNHGEMLSCNNMGKLAGKVFSTAGLDNIDYTVKKGDLNNSETIECLLDGGALLVPYDAYVNHSPDLKNGHTAHWCLVSGIIIIDEPNISKDSENFYVLTRHGKSKFLSAWKLADLAKSNMNLWEFSPKKQADGLEYVQPVGGLGGENGLRGQYLLFRWT